MTHRIQRLPALLITLGLLTAGCEQPSTSDAPQPPDAKSLGSSLSEADAPNGPPLDLTMDRDELFEFDANGDELDTSERSDLPRLVGPDKDKRLRVNGGVITNDEAIGLRDRVDGAEVSFELKTD